MRGDSGFSRFFLCFFGVLVTRKEVEKWDEKRGKKGLGLGFWRRGEARVLEERDLERKRRQAMENDFWR